MVGPTSASKTGQTRNLSAQVSDFSFSYDGDKWVLQNINMPLYRHNVTALIGPSGCGKTTLLRSFNRMHDLYRKTEYRGEIRLFPDDINILAEKIDPIEVRMRVGMVFQKPNPFPKSIFENVVYGLKIRGVNKKSVLEEKAVKALKDAALWDEVKDRLDKPGTALSGGQQQRLCIARALATDPEILLLDEPTSALDPIATSAIEELIHELKDRVTVLIVTHSMQQARRFSDYTAFMYLGELVEYGKSTDIFTKPKNNMTERYISGQFG